MKLSKAKNKYSEFILNKIDEVSHGYPNAVLVIQGRVDLVDFSDRKDLMADGVSFFEISKFEGFNEDWALDIRIELRKEKKYHLLSFPQFAYMREQSKQPILKDRIIIIKDNLCQLYPISQSDYIEVEKEENVEKRPSGLPIFQSEQIKFEDKYYYSINTTNTLDYTIKDVFTESKKIETKPEDDKNNYPRLNNELYSLDIFIDNCFRNNEHNDWGLIVIPKKYPMRDELVKKFELANSFLASFGGGFIKFHESDIPTRYFPKERELNILREYWDKDANFRTFQVYEKPDLGKGTLDISQGQIVEILIDEFENSQKNVPYRDIFITAPTGIGKSLLFQLAAFHVSERGGITIVVSPLIALMKDQVDAIIKDRGFSKVAYINSELNYSDRVEILNKCKQGEIDLLYMSPELLLSYKIDHFIGERNLGLLVIDEAHLITTWGRDFRVDYWFLGDHIRKIRKYYDLSFPMVSLTATAVYGGENDMVFDCVDSLNMINPHFFIGQVIRNDIEFVVNNYDDFSNHYKKKKVDQTSKFIQSLIKLNNIKTLVYVPYTKHVSKILNNLNPEERDLCGGYHGKMLAETKDISYRNFRSGKIKTLVSTKAFGMGVDIKDIQVIYHHAPSGLLPDYIQEIGRAAREKNIEGIAALNYSSKDQSYSKLLHGMSAIRQYQIKAVLKKIYESYKREGYRNLLFSIEEFGHIFNTDYDLDQKVMTSLMMIEKDYLLKNRFHVIVSRPKKLFVKVFAKIKSEEFSVFSKDFNEIFSVIKETKGYKVLELDLHKFWSKFFRDESFPKFKSKFYKKDLMREYGNIDLEPMLKISLQLVHDVQKTREILDKVLSITLKVLSSLGSHYFTKEQFEKSFIAPFGDKKKAKEVSKYLLSSFSGRALGPGRIEKDAFLQKKLFLDSGSPSGTHKYKTFNNLYMRKFNSFKQLFNKMFEDFSQNYFENYIQNHPSTETKYLKLFELIEILGLGTFEIKGGESLMLFVRLNDPERIRRDFSSRNYSNSILKRTLEKHEISYKLFNHFFKKKFSNHDRWMFIEDLFLGEDIDTLMEKHPGETSKTVDIIQEIKKKKFPPVEQSETSKHHSNSIHIFWPNKDKFYNEKSNLTIDSGNVETMSIYKWIKKDPVKLDKIRRKENLKFDKRMFYELLKVLRTDHHDYYKEALGSKYKIPFPGYTKPVSAYVPLKQDPEKFYKWWIKNEDSVFLSNRDKIELFSFIRNRKPEIIKKKHLRWLETLRR